MATTIEKLREMRCVAVKNHDKIIRAYYDEVNAHERGEPLPSMFSSEDDDVRLGRNALTNDTASKLKSSLSAF